MINGMRNWVSESRSLSPALCLGAALLVAGHASAEAPEAQPAEPPREELLVVLASGVEPKPIDIVRPIYPRAAAVNGVESWVQLGFVVTEEGTVTEIEVLESGGRSRVHRDIEKAAVKALKRWRFEPATVDGVPVRRTATQTIDFMLDPSIPSVTPGFKKQAAEAADALTQGDLDRMKSTLEALNERPLQTKSERMFRSFLWGMYFEASGEQARALEEAESALGVFHDTERTAAYYELLRMTFRLNALESNFRTALLRYEELRSDEGVLAEEDPIHGQAQRVRDRLDGNEAIAVSGVTERCERCDGDTYLFARDLNRNRFYVDAAPDVVERIKIDCGPAHVSFAWRADLVWKLDHEPGACEVTIYGQPNRPVTLVELSETT